MRSPALTLALAPLGLVALLTACPAEEEAPRCTTPPPASCAPLYEPTFTQIFTRTLRPSCGLEGSSCHADDGRQGGLVFVREDESYDLLIAKGEVRAGDPACSELVVRLLSTAPFTRMPPGKPLDPGAQCAIRLWIERGAKR